MFVFVFYTTVAKCIFKQNHGWPRPQTTGRSVNFVRQRWVGAPNELAAFKFHDAVVDIVERTCGAHETSPSQILS